MVTTEAQLQWRPTNAPLASSRTDDIWFLDPVVGWAVNSNGQILKTSDGGMTWGAPVPAFGGDTISPRCPLPIGATRSMIRAVRSSVLPVPVSSFSLSSGKSGVRFSKSTLLRAFSGAS